MDCLKTGRLIAALRKEKGFTQRKMAQALGISPKTVSKWECGLGCPDLTLWPELSAMLGVEMAQMMAGEITPNQPDAGNMARLKFYVCPQCGNILTATGSAAVACCGRRLEPLRAGPAPEELTVRTELSDGEYYVTLEHPMAKAHHLKFAAFIRYDQMLLKRLYPEQEATLRLAQLRGGKLFVYCTVHGLIGPLALR